MFAKPRVSKVSNVSRRSRSAYDVDSTLVIRLDSALDLLVVPTVGDETPPVGDKTSGDAPLRS